MPKIKPYVTVAELIAHLQTFPPKMRVICTRYSDYQYAELPEVVEGVEVNGGEYVRQFHWSERDPSKVQDVRKYCHFEGN